MARHEKVWLKGAEKIGGQICREAIWHGDKCNWVSGRLEPYNQQSRVVFSALGGDFYAGTSGVAYFLAALYSRSRNPLHKETALGAIRQALSCRTKDENDRWGFYLGWPGIAYASAAVARWTEEDALRDRSVELLSEMAGSDPGSLQTDLMNGCAGALICAVEFEKRSIGGPWNDFIFKLADLLEKQAEIAGTGLSWRTAGASTHNLCGFAHGAAGIGTAFLNLYELTRTKKYLDVATRAFRYENQYFDGGEKNWPDFRARTLPAEEEARHFSCAWCHGAPGITLSRMRAFQLTGDDSFKEDAVPGLETTSRQLKPDKIGNYSLCHGLCGNADTLLLAASILNHAAYRDKAEEIGNYCIEFYLDRDIPMPNGAFANWFNPDLMLGLSGTGYFLLRLTDPDLFESPLLIGSQDRNIRSFQAVMIV